MTRKVVTTTHAGDELYRLTRAGWELLSTNTQQEYGIVGQRYVTEEDRKHGIHNQKIDEYALVTRLVFVLSRDADVDEQENELASKLREAESKVWKAERALEEIRREHKKCEDKNAQDKQTIVGLTEASNRRAIQNDRDNLQITTLQVQLAKAAKAQTGVIKLVREIATWVEKGVEEKATDPVRIALADGIRIRFLEALEQAAPSKEEGVA